MSAGADYADRLRTSSGRMLDHYTAIQNPDGGLEG
jgi:hypothetical protein